MLYILGSLCLGLCLAGIHAENNNHGKDLPFGGVLNHYEFIETFHMKHHIVKRNAHNPKHIEERRLEFTAMNKNFNLYLIKSSRILANGFRVVEVDENDVERTVKLTASDINIYHGYLEDDPQNSRASVAFEDSETMSATISTPDETFVVEPSWRHFDEGSVNATGMIAYKKSDLDLRKSLGDHLCGYSKQVMDDLYEGMDISDRHAEPIEENKKDRVRRQSAQTSTASKDTCPLLLVADYRFHNVMGQGKILKTTTYLLSLVDRVDAIYRRTNWGQGYTDFGFEVREIKVHPSPSRAPSGGIHYNQDRDWDTKELLELFSANAKFKGVCLAHLFTHIGFESGTLGLAYIGSPRTYSVGGVCTRVYHKGGKALYLNTGWSSSLNRYNRRLLTSEADIVTMHEFGHNWGSEHDPDTTECNPNSFEGGKYIMYTYSVAGYDTNNRVFSPCSIRSIGAVLRSKANLCFKERTGQYCGNSRVEAPFEECDPGPEDAGRDPCCTEFCKFRSGSVCSDRNDECCTGCQIAGPSKPCYETQDEGCLAITNCDGKSKKCPPPLHKNDGDACLERGTCQNGTCLSFCESNGRISCMCEELENSCKWCCRNSTEDLQCTPFSGDKRVSHHNLQDGMPCVQGMCTNGVCEKQVQDLVQRLWNVIETLTPNKLVEIMRSNIVGTVIILSLLIWIPASCVVSCLDKKKVQENQAKEDIAIPWGSAQNTALVMPQDQERKNLSIREAGHRVRNPNQLHLNIPKDTVREGGMRNPGYTVNPSYQPGPGGDAPPYVAPSGHRYRGPDVVRGLPPSSTVV